MSALSVSTPTTESADRRPTLAGVLLGAFIAWQLLALAIANYFSVLNVAVPEVVSQLPEAAVLRRLPLPVEICWHVSSGWLSFLGQPQCWSLFSSVRRELSFPVVAFSRAAATADVDPLDYVDRRRSAVEPDDTNTYIRLELNDRRKEFDRYVEMCQLRWTAASLERETDLDKRIRTELLRRQWRPVLAFLQWHVRSYRLDHPGEPPPRQVVLLMRVYELPVPGGEYWRGPVERFIARWQPEIEPPAGCVPLELYDPHERRFVPVNAELPAARMVPEEGAHD